MLYKGCLEVIRTVEIGGNPGIFGQIQNLYLFAMPAVLMPYIIKKKDRHNSNKTIKSKQIQDIIMF